MNELPDLLPCNSATVVAVHRTIMLEKWVWKLWIWECTMKKAVSVKQVGSLPRAVLMNYVVCWGSIFAAVGKTCQVSATWNTTQRDNWHRLLHKEKKTKRKQKVGARNSSEVENTRWRRNARPAEEYSASGTLNAQKLDTSLIRKRIGGGIFVNEKKKQKRKEKKENISAEHIVHLITLRRAR